ncbi:hypothetical protein [Mycobacterium sp. 3519A]|uniref:hypothetical protein n=1 Tax=Mycobacterium sp. 3519A TaxID=2057184 RepID=UPI00135A270A|nr:hypothetical protein [Mycobacterium sp. 3519A]
MRPALAVFAYAHPGHRQIGPNPNISQRPSILSNATRKIDAVRLGAFVPMVVL